ncbi:MAG: prolyl oligopeptidase family serine peptidase [Bacteroidota bacterium]
MNTIQQSVPARFSFFLIAFSLLLLLSLTGCDKETPLHETSPEAALSTGSFQLTSALDNQEIYLTTSDGRTVKAYLSKKAGTLTKGVLLLHAGTKDLLESQTVTAGLNSDPYGGQPFYDRDYICLSVEFTEYFPGDIKATRGKEELLDVLAGYDYLNATLAQQAMPLDTLVAFGGSRGGTNALRLGIAREFNAVVANSAAVNWFAVHDSIQSGFLDPSEEDSIAFYESVFEWGNPDITPDKWFDHSVGLRVDAFKTRYHMINGELDEAVMVHTIRDMETAYEACVDAGDCEDESVFFIHPGGHVDWRADWAFEMMFDFIEKGKE